MSSRSSRRRLPARIAIVTAAASLAAGGIALTSASTQAAGSEFDITAPGISSDVTGATSATAKVTDKNWEFHNATAKNGGVELSGVSAAATLYFDPPLKVSDVKKLHALAEPTTGTANDKGLFWNLQIDKTRTPTQAVNLTDSGYTTDTGEAIWHSTRAIAGLPSYRETPGKGSEGTLAEYNKTSVTVYAVAIRTNSNSPEGDAWLLKNMSVNDTTYTFEQAKIPEPTTAKDITVSKMTADSPFPLVSTSRTDVTFTLTGPQGQIVNVDNALPAVKLNASGAWSVKTNLVNPGMSEWSGGGTGTLPIKDLTIAGVQTDLVMKATGTPTKSTGTDGTATLDITNPLGQRKPELSVTYQVGAQLAKTVALKNPTTTLSLTGLKPGHTTVKAHVTSYPEISGELDVFVPAADYTNKFTVATSIKGDTNLGSGDPEDGKPRVGPNGEITLTVTNKPDWDMDFDIALTGSGMDKEATKTVGASDSGTYTFAGLRAGDYKVTVTPKGSTPSVAKDVSVIKQDAPKPPVTTFTAGGTITNSGQLIGESGGKVEVWIYSTPIKIGEATVAPNGLWSFRGTIPANLPAGRHQLVFFAPSGRVISSTPITVKAAAPAPGPDDGTVTPTDDGTTDPADSKDNGKNDTPTPSPTISGKHLAKAGAGASLVVPGLAGLGLLLAGAGTFGLSRTRRNRA